MTFDAAPGAFLRHHDPIDLQRRRVAGSRGEVRPRSQSLALGGKGERGEQRLEPTDVPYCDRRSPSASALAPAAADDSPDPWPGLATGLLGEFWFSGGVRGLVCFFLDRSV